MKKWIERFERRSPALAGALFAAVLILAGTGLGVAVAQLATPPSVTVIHPNADLVQVVPNGTAGPNSVFATPAQLKASGAYYKSVPSTGFTFTFGNTQLDAAFRPTTTLSTGAITMPPNPSDGDRPCFWSKNIITTLTVSANTGQSINDAVTTLGAAGHACYVYSLSNATWDRVE